MSPLEEGLLDELLGTLRLTRADLDPLLPPAFVWGGNPHPIVFVKEGVLAGLDHDGDAVLALQDREGWDGTVPVVRRLSENRFASRNPFPRGGIREDPATGSAAASLGYYLRDRRHVALPAVVEVEQGAETGRPSHLIIEAVSIAPASSSLRQPPRSAARATPSRSSRPWPCSMRHVASCTPSSLRTRGGRRAQIILERGYGLRFGIADDELSPLVGAMLSREQTMAEADVVRLPKPQDSDLHELRDGQVLWGWPHCVQDRAITQLAIDKSLTLIA